MSKTQIITMETIKTIGQGALGAMTFGAYHQFTTNKIMELNNEKMELKNKYLMDKMENEHKKEMNELNEKLDKMQKIVEDKRWW